MNGKKTMTVQEMGRMLGLGKTESYWLVHKHFFKIVYVDNKMRIDIESFESWYQNQVKYHKVDGTKPGEQLKADSFALKEIGPLLGLTSGYSGELVKKEHIPVITVDYQIRVRKEDFFEWYRNQSYYRIKEDRVRDTEAEAASLSMPEMARLLGLEREDIYRLLNNRKMSEGLEIVVIGGRKRITRESFEKWYRNQKRYTKLEERKKRRKPVKKVRKVIRSQNPDYLTVIEVAELYHIPRTTVYYWARKKKAPFVKAISSYRVRRTAFEEWYSRKGK